MKKVLRIPIVVLICSFVSMCCIRGEGQDSRKPGVNLSKEERIFGLVTIYRAALQHFSYSQQVPQLDRYKVFMEFIPLVEK